MVQRRAARYGLRRYHNTSVSDMIDHLQWPTLAQRRFCYRLTLLYIAHNIAAVPSNQYISPHQTMTRSNSLAYLPVSCNTYQNSFFPKTVSHWNALPEHNYSLCIIPPHLQDSISHFHNFVAPTFLF